mmetsp:Transcript_17611/g.40229  ORF Transcript_17611/g.40229 Transcript_17611/m.40229 type:complete len:169 (+) Transcript_17611:308-814(+)|eukprot:CAMPEP_0201138250 /NCGR_PEP_ID=MMETSP0850-20130426/55832_1 /ASSEMBLY_ACC=CAM_ASM_000622 /TAXON_ID=183588 /ORGANISM="Pseudo-nitzschia fraudulenta, Strain WWA7" /LENGTH=168 /DNA_ID=CAMNT_0047409637 /DNA_START=488 /DNA_END=994 /DNA_ORIENTATION=+
MPNEIDNQMNRTHDFDEPSVQMSVASSFYGGGVTITGGGPDEIFKDEYGNESSRYVNRTIIINEHMASAAETRNHNGRDIVAPDNTYGSAFRRRSIAFLFVVATIVLLLIVLLDFSGSKGQTHSSSSNNSNSNNEDKLAAVMGFDIADDWDDDDDAWDKYTQTVLGDD